jgi:hypothetical protein
VPPSAAIRATTATTNAGEIRPFPTFMHNPLRRSDSVPNSVGDLSPP